MADSPSPAELDALDTLLRGGTAADALRGGEAPALAGAAAALTAATSSEAGFDADRLWMRVQTGVAPTRAVPAARRISDGRRPAPAKWSRRWAGGAAALAAAAAVLAVLLSVWLLDSGSADAHFLASVTDLEAESNAALTDSHLSLAELRRLRVRVTELVEAFDRDRDTLPRLSLRDVEAALGTLQRVRVRLEGAADAQLRDRGVDRASEVALRRFVADSIIALRRVRVRAEEALGREPTDRIETGQSTTLDEPSRLDTSDEAPPPGDDPNTVDGAATTDTAPTDAVTRDAATAGTATRDTNTTDTATRDTSTTDAVTRDANTTDAVTRDAATSDTLTRDTATTDSATTDSTTDPNDSPLPVDGDTGTRAVDSATRSDSLSR